MIAYIHQTKGTIIGAVHAETPDAVITKLPEGCVAVYFDDQEHPQLFQNYGNVQYDFAAQSLVERVFTPEEIAQAKQMQIEYLMRRRDEEIQAGFTSATTGHDYFYDPTDQLKLQGQSTLLLLDPSLETIEWKTKSAGYVAHTREEFIAVLKEAGQHERDLHKKYELAAQKIQAAATMSALQEALE